MAEEGEMDRTLEIVIWIILSLIFGAGLAYLLWTITH